MLRQCNGGVGLINSPGALTFLISSLGLIPTWSGVAHKNYKLNRCWTLRYNNSNYCKWAKQSLIKLLAYKPSCTKATGIPYKPIFNIHFETPTSFFVAQGRPILRRIYIWNSGPWVWLIVVLLLPKAGYSPVKEPFIKIPMTISDWVRWCCSETIYQTSSGNLNLRFELKASI